MSERTRREHGDNPDAAPGGAGGNGRLTQLRAEGQRLATEAERVIARALSGDSERWLHNSRQEGGE